MQREGRKIMNGLLKFITCGSVDDGKSTLIGHLLYDAKLIYADQEEALELDSKVGSRGGKIDYSLLLDGLMAEREQGITIDVAYRYFTTDNRSFIVADTPGHEEYTRNMAVGASFADLAVILIDAEHGVLTQTRRHARICELMGIRHFVFAVNKMDLVHYSEYRFGEILAQIQELEHELELANIQVIPVSATEGDNVTKVSPNMPWYQGPTILSFLENVDVSATHAEQGFYLPVQRVCRPSHEFRGFQGQIEAGEVKVGDALTTLPSNETAHVQSILVGDRQVESAFAGQPVTISLDREVDTSRGCVLEKDARLKVGSTVQAQILWMDDTTLENGKNFLIKLGTKQIPGLVTRILYKIDVNTGEKQKAQTLHKNEIAVCDISFTEPIVVDEFAAHRTMGELILIDRISNQTSACGVVTAIRQDDRRAIGTIVDSRTRSAIKGQTPVNVQFRLGSEVNEALVQKVEQILARDGRHTYLYHPVRGESYGNVVRHLNSAGIIVLLVLDEGLPVDEKISVSAFYGNEPGVPSAEEIAEKIRGISAFAISSDADNWSI